MQFTIIGGRSWGGEGARESGVWWGGERERHLGLLQHQTDVKEIPVRRRKNRSLALIIS